MTKAKMTVNTFEKSNSLLSIAVSFAPENKVVAPRVSVLFTADGGDRRLPMKVTYDGTTVTAQGDYNPADLFYGFTPNRVEISFVFSDGTDNGEVYETDLYVDGIRRRPVSRFVNSSAREKKKTLAAMVFNLLSLGFRLLPIKKNRVTFLSNRTDVPTGNLKAAYDTVKTMDGVDIRVLCKSGAAGSIKSILPRFLYLYMTSKVVYVDDYYHLISYVKKKKGTTLVQLWHGCGAFKTFGFSRYHKDSALELYSANHRQYDLAIVSSEEVAELYAEAFGISRNKVLALGSPRCDVLTDTAYRKEMRTKFFDAFPSVKDKKILLFAPTFRGKGNGDCYYPVEKFDVNKVLDALGDDWAVVVKMHPYLKERIVPDDKHGISVIESDACADWDINDILPATDYLVSDYSSVIFEASILDIPMVFLAFDLEDFIEKRDFYYDYKSFVPGPVVSSDMEAAAVICEGKPDLEKVRAFCKRSFDATTGSACDNIRHLTEELLER